MTSYIPAGFFVMMMETTTTTMMMMVMILLKETTVTARVPLITVVKLIMEMKMMSNRHQLDTVQISSLQAGLLSASASERNAKRQHNSVIQTSIEW